MVRFCRPLLLAGAFTVTTFGTAYAETHAVAKSLPMNATDVSTKHQLLSSSNRNLKKQLASSNPRVKAGKRAKQPK